MFIEIGENTGATELKDIFCERPFNLLCCVCGVMTGILS